MRSRGLSVSGVWLSFALVAVACGGSPVSQAPSPLPTPIPTPNLPVLMAAGDISCDGATPDLPCKSKETSDLILTERAARSFLLALPLGDLQYQSGTLPEFLRYYHSTWGRLNAFARPVPGNHEYETRNASGYYDYFAGQGVPVGNRSEGWYSYDFGNWHFVALNSNCGDIGGCQAGSPQYRWLQADLIANQRKCTLAYMHHPFVSTGLNGSTPALLPFMRLLYENKAEIVLAGHDHEYERFVPITPDQVPDAASGFRVFVVGTGGRDLRNFVRPALPIGAFRSNEHFGALRIVMRDAAYDWAFLNLNGSIVDSGSGFCF